MPAFDPYGRPTQQMAQRPAAASGMKTGSSVQGNQNAMMQTSPSNQNFNLGAMNGGNTGFGGGLQPQVQRQGPNGQWYSPGQSIQQAPTQSNQNQNPQFGNYEGGRDAWMSGRYGRTEDGIRNWNNEFGLLKNYQGGDVGELANGGGYIDLLEAFKSGNPTRATWTAAGNNGPNPNGAGGGGGPVQMDPMAQSQQMYGPRNQFQFNPQLQSLHEDALKKAMTGSMSPDVVAQMKETQKMQALEMEKNNLQNLSQGFASRGLSEMSGLQQALAGQQKSDTQKNLLGGYRDIDIGAADQNRRDLLGGIGAMGNYRNQLFGEHMGAQGMDLDNRALSQALQIAQMQNELGWGNVGFNYANLDSNNQMNLLRMMLGF